MRVCVSAGPAWPGSEGGSDSSAALAQGRGQPPGPLMAAASSAARSGLASRSPLFPAAAAESSALARLHHFPQSIPRH